MAKAKAEQKSENRKYTGTRDFHRAIAEVWMESGAELPNPGSDKILFKRRLSEHLLTLIENRYWKIRGLDEDNKEIFPFDDTYVLYSWLEFRKKKPPQKGSTAEETGAIITEEWSLIFKLDLTKDETDPIRAGMPEGRSFLDQLRIFSSKTPFPSRDDIKGWIATGSWD